MFVRSFVPFQLNVVMSVEGGGEGDADECLSGDSSAPAAGLVLKAGADGVGVVSG